MKLRRGRPGRGGAPRRRSIQVSCKRGIPRDLGSVVHQRRCAVDDDAAVTAERTERLVAGRRRIKCRCRDVVDVEAHRDRAVRPQDLEAGLVTAGQVAERVPVRPADGVGAIAVVVGRRELAVCDRDVARERIPPVLPPSKLPAGHSKPGVLVGVGVGVGVNVAVAVGLA